MALSQRALAASRPYGPGARGESTTAARERLGRAANRLLMAQWRSLASRVKQVAIGDIIDSARMWAIDLRIYAFHDRLRRMRAMISPHRYAIRSRR
jgi:hypothetical protein